MRPRLPIFPQRFTVSSLHSIESVKALRAEVEKECSRILDKHALLIPNSYRSLINNIRSHHNEDEVDDIVTKDVIFQQFANGMNHDDFLVALQYCHAIGRIVVLKNGLVCINPELIPKISAKFISPEEVRLNLSKSTGIVEVLNQAEIGYLLLLDPEAERY